jgi:hypothetical protein
LDGGRGCRIRTALADRHPTAGLARRLAVYGTAPRRRREARAPACP